MTRLLEKSTLFLETILHLILPLSQMENLYHTIFSCSEILIKDFSQQFQTICILIYKCLDCKSFTLFWLSIFDNILYLKHKLCQWAQEHRSA